MTHVHGLAARVGRRAFPVTSWEQVSQAYRDTIAELGLGVSRAPRCEILNLLGEVVAHVGYNGTVWSGPAHGWRWDGAKPIYDPR